ncbi:MAG: hypothetical protein OEZ06_21270 [Myxococcales bacterium]|nr:hypothetical protein [Myxococcales bacterium]
MFVPTAVHAGGIEYTGQGAQSLARGGAVAARAEDPMVLAHNPAGLVELRASHLMINLNLALFDACVQPFGYYGWGTYIGGVESQIPDPDGGEALHLPLNQDTGDGLTSPAAAEAYYNDPLDSICLNQNVVPIPQIAWTSRLTEDFGVGFGLIFPAAQPAGKWGGKYGVIRGDDGDLRPSPVRYMMLQSSSLGVFPNFGMAYRIDDMIRVGASFEWGIIAVNNYVMAAMIGGTPPAQDIVAHVKAQDWFIPAVTASVHLVPMDALDLVLAFRYQDDINASGDVDLTTGIFNPNGVPTTTSNLGITSLSQPMPWKLRAGVRYADRFAPRPSGTGDIEADLASPEVIHDPLQDERWDIELDVEYQANGGVDRQVVEYEQGGQLEFKPVGDGVESSLVDFPHPAVPTTEIEKHWNDQVSVRLGGSLNLLPGKVAVSAGAHYENRGINADYMQVDFWPVARFGLHGGLLFRVAKRIDLVLAYAHIFQETIVVAAPQHELRDQIFAESLETGSVSKIDKRSGPWLDRSGTTQEVLEEDPVSGADGEARVEQNLSRTAADQPAYIINAGRYTSSFDILAAGINVHF